MIKGVLFFFRSVVVAILFVLIGIYGFFAPRRASVVIGKIMTTVNTKIKKEI